jgi:hypothetical protein
MRNVKIEESKIIFRRRAMRKLKLIMFFFLMTGWVFAQDATPTPSPIVSDLMTGPTPTPQVIKNWSVASVPWDVWFHKNARVTVKPDYVHFFWTAQSYQGNFEGKGKKVRLAEAALEMVKRLYPKDATADLIKVDIVYVLEFDNYGRPNWFRLKKVAHMEFSREKALKLTEKKAGLSEALIDKIFTQCNLL